MEWIQVIVILGVFLGGFFYLANKIDQNCKEIQNVRTELSKEIQNVRTDLTKEIQNVRTDLTKEIQNVRTELSKEIQNVRTDLTKEIQKNREEILWVKFRLDPYEHPHKKEEDADEN